MTAYPDANPGQDEAVMPVAPETKRFMGTAVLAPLPDEIVPEGQFAETILPNGERLGVTLHEYAAAYLDRMLLNPNVEDIPDEAASFRYLQATPEERQSARDRVIAECANPQIERMALPLMRLGAIGDINHEIRVAAMVALMNVDQADIDAALIHDDGKAYVYGVVSKPGQYTDAERNYSKLHVRGTLMLAEQVGITDRRVLVDVNEHHDYNTDPAKNYVGSEELRSDSEESHQKALKLKVADEFDALSSARGYKAALPLRETLQIMEGQIDAPRTVWNEFYRLVTPAQEAAWLTVRVSAL